MRIDTELVDLPANQAEGWAIHGQAYEAPWDVVDQPIVDFAHSLGLKVQPWTVNSEATMYDLIELGVDGIMTEQPARLFALARELGLA